MSVGTGEAIATQLLAVLHRYGSMHGKALTNTRHDCKCSTKVFGGYTT